MTYLSKTVKTPYPLNLGGKFKIIFVPSENCVFEGVKGYDVEFIQTTNGTLKVNEYFVFDFYDYIPIIFQKLAFGREVDLDKLRATHIHSKKFYFYLIKE